MSDITIACLDMAGTTVRDDGTVLTAFRAAIEQAGLASGTPRYDEALGIVAASMGQSKIEVFRRVLGDEGAAQQANSTFEESYALAVMAGQVAAMPGAEEAMAALREAGILVCLNTGFSPVTRDAIIGELGWHERIDLALSPADAGRGRPWPDLPLTALMRLGGEAVTSLAVVGDTISDVQTGMRAGAGLVAGVLTGATTREEFDRADTPLILASVADLPAHLGVPTQP
ncbi:MAG TPA: HAD family hydrolase [Streptosporangiaceae bacterium]|jgi:phosphonatase-like hydrolase